MVKYVVYVYIFDSDVFVVGFVAEFYVKVIAEATKAADASVRFDPTFIEKVKQGSAK